MTEVRCDALAVRAAKMFRWLQEGSMRDRLYGATLVRLCCPLTFDESIATSIIEQFERRGR